MGCDESAFPSQVPNQWCRREHAGVRSCFFVQERPADGESESVQDLVKLVASRQRIRTNNGVGGVLARLRVTRLQWIFSKTTITERRVSPTLLPRNKILQGSF